jgi:hypothetical protein
MRLSPKKEERWGEGRGDKLLRVFSPCFRNCSVSCLLQNKIFQEKKKVLILADYVKLCPTTGPWHIPCTYCSVNNLREPDPARSFTESLWKGLS